MSLQSRADPQQLFNYIVQNWREKSSGTSLSDQNPLKTLHEGREKSKKERPERNGSLPLGYSWAVITSRPTRIKKQPQDEALSYKDYAFLR